MRVAADRLRLVGPGGADSLEGLPLAQTGRREAFALAAACLTVTLAVGPRLPQLTGRAAVPAP